MGAFSWFISGLAWVMPHWGILCEFCANFVRMCLGPVGFVRYTMYVEVRLRQCWYWERRWRLLVLEDLPFLVVEPQERLYG
jgi:hypothetical protein